jgi:hypothetical protein
MRRCSPLREAFASVEAGLSLRHGQQGGGRRMTAVHLERPAATAPRGCEAACLIFWKRWLKRVEERGSA